MDSLRKVIKIIAIITLCLCISGCATLVQGFFDGLSETETKEEAKRKQQNPALMIEEVERKRWEETSRDIQRQNEKEEAAKEKEFDEMFQKQLQSGNVTSRKSKDSSAESE